MEDVQEHGRQCLDLPEGCPHLLSLHSCFSSFFFMSEFSEPASGIERLSLDQLSHENITMSFVLTWNCSEDSQTVFKNSLHNYFM